jgi:hypothetical protein
VHSGRDTAPGDNRRARQVSNEIEQAMKELDALEIWLETHQILHLKNELTRGFIAAEYPPEEWVATLSAMEAEGELLDFVRACAKAEQREALARGEECAGVDVEASARGLPTAKAMVGSLAAHGLPLEVLGSVLCQRVLTAAERLAASLVCRNW